MSEKRGESDEAVGRGPRTRRFSFRTVRGTVPTTGNSPYNGTVPTTGDSLHRKHVIAVVGNGSQPFRRAALRQAQGDLPLPPPEGDTSNEQRVTSPYPLQRGTPPPAPPPNLKVTRAGEIVVMSFPQFPGGNPVISIGYGCRFPPA